MSGLPPRRHTDATWRRALSRGLCAGIDWRPGPLLCTSWPLTAMFVASCVHVRSMKTRSSPQDQGYEAPSVDVLGEATGLGRDGMYKAFGDMHSLIPRGARTHSARPERLA